MNLEVLEYDAERDFDAVRRIWRDVGWIEPEEESQDEGLKAMLQGGRCVVTPVHGSAECSVIRLPGSLRYQQRDLSLGIVAAVTTSRVARRLGAARLLTAETLALLAAEGHVVAGLGMFDQGFYDQLGFGSGSYVPSFRLDPKSIQVERPVRPPAPSHP